MSNRSRGADLLVRALEMSGLTTVFTLSGNHIMPLFDAALGSQLRLVHVRHEASAVHMADAFARLTGRCGIALVTGGAGHTNAVAALPTALAAESPIVLLSGHAPLSELGRGSFQELAQADMAAPVTKASWTARSAATLAEDLAEAVRIATSGRPGPVHVSLPVDCLEERVDAGSVRMPDASAFAQDPARPDPEDVATVLEVLREAERPLILAGPVLCRGVGAEALARLADALGIPAVGMESPRGINDPSLGAFAEVLRRADLILLLGKPHDFTIRFGEPPFVDGSCRFAVIDPDPALVERVRRDKAGRLIASFVSDPIAAAKALAEEAPPTPGTGWRREVEDAVAYRPPKWIQTRSAQDGKVHPAELCRALAACLDRHRTAVLVCDGGEIGQWPQTILRDGPRIINGVAGSIGAGVPFAIGARAATGGPVIAVMGDGAFGFHLSEFDTALRYDLPMVVVVGNDAAWNAEHQIQIRSYGADRAHGCELLPTRYDQVVAAFGCRGEHVTSAQDLEAALERALSSGQPTCVNVAIERIPAPVMKRPS